MLQVGAGYETLALSSIVLSFTSGTAVTSNHLYCQITGMRSLFHSNNIQVTERLVMAAAGA